MSNDADAAAATPNHPGDHQGATSSTGTVGAVSAGNSSKNPMVVALLLVIALLLAVIAGLIATRPQGGVTPAAPSAAETADSQAAGPPPSGNETLAPTITQADTLKLLHAEVKRDANDGQAKGKVDAPVVLVLLFRFCLPLLHLVRPAG